MSTVVFRGRYGMRPSPMIGAALANLTPIRWAGVLVAGVAIVAIAFTTTDQFLLQKTPHAVSPRATADAELRAESPRPRKLSATPDAISPRAPPALIEKKVAVATPEKDQARLEKDLASRDNPAAAPAKRDLSYLHYYVYSELPPTEKPADIVLESLKDTPPGTSIDEIKHAAEAFGLDFNFMKAIAKIESGFDPKQRTGSYIGLFQLSKYEFGLYGSGDILDARDNAVAAAYKFLAEAALFEWHTNKKPTFTDLYMIHQQGWQGAAEHVLHPERIAWKSMCATDEGREKGEKWCKRAVWGNTLPAIKHIWKSVDNMTSSAFVTMWHDRINQFYSRYSEATSDPANAEATNTATKH